MTKYRIVKIDEPMFIGRPTYYIIEKRRFGIWWKIESLTYDRTFDTMDDAKQFLENLKKKRKKTVVYEDTI